ncbi:MAG: HDOD domain-containing protein, partial [Planctomycetota bacterium]
SALRRATLARRLAELLHPAQSAESFTMGLLQDMGVPVLAAARTAEYDPIFASWLEDSDLSECLTTVEKERLGTTHEEVGRLLGNYWEMPDDLLKAIGEHHNNEDGGVLSAVSLVSHLREGEHPGEIEAIVARAEEEFGLDSEVVLELVDEAFAEAAELEVMMR